MTNMRETDSKTLTSYNTRETSGIREQDIEKKSGTGGEGHKTHFFSRKLELFLKIQVKFEKH